MQPARCAARLCRSQMAKTSAGLLGAVAGLAAIGVTQAATPLAIDPSEALQGASYAEPLRRLLNAADWLKARGAAPTEDPVSGVMC